ncbi:MAG TPA: GlxA family transcriptional regulator [Deinococcales bacterium]|nr:GlxA family transcriptional regulator [Deinococcales bacterium]
MTISITKPAAGKHQARAPRVRPRGAARRRVVFLLVHEVHLLDLAGPAQAFHTARVEGAPYEISFRAATPTVLTAQGLTLSGLEPPPTVGPGDLIVVPGMRCEGRLPSGMLLPPSDRWLREAYEAGTQVASVCSGAVALGEAGLLAGRRYTTHWSIIEAMRARHPNAHPEEDTLFVEDGNLVTSAGVTSGIDMALWLIEGDMGPLFAARVARDLVVYMRRDGSQGQRSIYLEFRTHQHPGVHRVQDWLANHPAEKVTLEELARIANMSPRTLERTFKAAAGFTPLQYQQQLRLELAQSLMRDPRLSLEAVAERCGFEDPRHFRRLWKASFGAPPSQSRPSARVTA